MRRLLKKQNEKNKRQIEALNNMRGCLCNETNIRTWKNQTLPPLEYFVIPVSSRNNLCVVYNHINATNLCLRYHTDLTEPILYPWIIVFFIFVWCIGCKKKEKKSPQKI